jgi:hypothetical protein
VPTQDSGKAKWAAPWSGRWRLDVLRLTGGAFGLRRQSAATTALSLGTARSASRCAAAALQKGDSANRYGFVSRNQKNWEAHGWLYRVATIAASLAAIVGLGRGIDELATIKRKLHDESWLPRNVQAPRSRPSCGRWSSYICPPLARGTPRFLRQGSSFFVAPCSLYCRGKLASPRLGPCHPICEAPSLTNGPT